MLALKPGQDTVWKEGSFGISEPSEDGSSEAKSSELDLIICPLAGFDEAGNTHRNGRGIRMIDFLQKLDYQRS